MANLEGIRITAYRKEFDGDAVTWTYFSSTTSIADGTYNLAGLIAGTYRIKFSDPNNNYITEYWDGAGSLEGANDIVVAAETTVSGKNASLEDASHITGTVTDTP